MKTYIHYVHDLPDDKPIRNTKYEAQLRKIKEVQSRFNSINELERSILNESSQRVFDMISEHLDLRKYFRSIVFSTENKSYVDTVDFSNVRAIINLKRINNIREINEHFASVNTLLPDAGIYIGRCETYYERRLRFYRTYGNRVGRVLWLVDFVGNRVFPKLRPFDKVYKLLFGKRPHVVSKAEILGRLVYNGFEILDFRTIDGMLYFAVMKTREPINDPEPTYHSLVRLNRVGKDGKLIRVYKFRTMYPYSEYLQDFVLKLNGYDENGKPAKDFRLAHWGIFFRMFRLDELPQLINVLRGEMKLVGVRPLSRTRYNEFPEDLQQERINYKPGCFPPYVALKMPDDKGNILAERIYLEEYRKSPAFTDIKYFFKAFFNMVSIKVMNRLTSSRKEGIATDAELIA